MESISATCGGCGRNYPNVPSTKVGQAFPCMQCRTQVEVPAVQICPGCYAEISAVCKVCPGCDLLLRDDKPHDCDKCGKPIDNATLWAGGLCGACSPGVIDDLGPDEAYRHLFPGF